ncbi:MAG: hypothetical protein NUW01_00910, partial [Gemmatimonadaceae bacterium]|nr:hypothetical protein [Gemmatimonadaceae bacterium]
EEIVSTKIPGGDDPLGEEKEVPQRHSRCLPELPFPHRMDRRRREFLCSRSPQQMRLSGVSEDEFIACEIFLKLPDIVTDQC